MLELGTFSNLCGEIDPAHELRIITFLTLASVLRRILIWVNIVYDLPLRNEGVHVLPDLKLELFLLKYGTNEGLYVWLPNLNDSFTLPLFRGLLSR